MVPTAEHRSSSATPIRVLVIDGSRAVGLGLVRLVGVMPGVHVCGLALHGEDGLQRAALTQPDVALVDADLPDDAALPIIRCLRAAHPALRIVALGLYPFRRSAALAAGAHTFAFKDAGFDALLAAIVAGVDSAPVSAQPPRGETA